MSQISLSIPDSTVCYNYEFALPLQISSATDDSIIAYQLDFNYDSDIISIYSATHKGAITEKWGEPLFNPTTEQFRVVGFSTESLFIAAEDSLDTLLFINVKVIKDIVGETTISVDQAFFYNIQGQLQVEFPPEYSSDLNMIHNESPYIQNIDDIKFFEDSTYTFNIVSKIGDSDNELDELEVRLETNDNFTYLYEDSNLTIIPDPHWSGVTSLIITVSDIFNYSDSDTINVTVLPIEDDPLPFNLISPQDTIIQSGENEIEFFWQESVNVDKNDSVTYTFYLGSDSTFQSGILQKHTSLYQESILLIFSVEEGVYYWGVKAVDLHGNEVWCNDKFNKLTVPTTGINAPESGSVKEFKIYQNHPNPFNSQTSIDYELAKPAQVLISVCDVRGRHIKMLRDDFMDSGSYTVIWNGLDNHNNSVSSGVYIISFKVENMIKMRKVVLAK